MTVVQQTIIWVDVWECDIPRLTCCMSLSSLLLIRQIPFFHPFWSFSITVTDQLRGIALNFSTAVTDQDITSDCYMPCHNWHTRFHCGSRKNRAREERERNPGRFPFIFCLGCHDAISIRLFCSNYSSQTFSDQMSVVSEIASIYIIFTFIIQWFLIHSQICTTITTI